MKTFSKLELKLFLFQRDFFTKTWGDSFVEKTDIPKPLYLPDITHVHFESYIRKIARVSSKYNFFLVNS
jgi:hypothetical protein